MKSAVAYRSGSASDPGPQRATNEDRLLADDARGLYAIADGLGGHAAGEKAAEIAIATLERLLGDSTPILTAERRIRVAVAEANNRIFEAAQSRADWQGMACVLTVALFEEDHVTIGQVGDTRLYLVSKGKIEKVTPDHSPVGEQEDGGELTEEQAMQHPRRSEVFRDVGSQLRGPDDPQFIHTDSLTLAPEAALLLCSDGLSDALRTEQILAAINRYGGDPSATAVQLVQAANAASGKDNVSVIFIPGPEFAVPVTQAAHPSNSRHTTTRMLSEEDSLRKYFSHLALLLLGIGIGIVLWSVLERVLPQSAPRHEPNSHEVLSKLHTITVSASDPRAISRALAAAQPGDTLLVPPGEYLAPLLLKDGVTIESMVPQSAIVRSDPAAGDDSGLAVIARHVNGVRVEGVRIEADQTHPLRIGVLVSDSSALICGTDISGALDTAVRADGGSRIRAFGNNLHDNPGSGVVLRDAAVASLVGNWVRGNGRLPNSLHPGLDFASSERPLLINNVVEQNGDAVSPTRRPR